MRASCAALSIITPRVSLVLRSLFLFLSLYVPLYWALSASSYVPFMGVYPSVSPTFICVLICALMCVLTCNMLSSQWYSTHTHTHTPGCERCPRVRLLLLYSLLVLNYFTLYYPLPNYSTFTHTHTPGDGNDAQGCAYRECGARRYRPYADRLSYPLYHCSLLYSLLGCAHLYYRPIPTIPLYYSLLINYTTTAGVVEREAPI